MLGTLSDNGGPTKTHALLIEGLAISPAIDAGNNALFGTFGGIQTSLAGGINATQVSLTVDDATFFPGTVPFQVRIDAEDMTVTEVAANTLTVDRGANGTTAAGHAAAAAVILLTDQRGFDRIVNGLNEGEDRVDIGSFEFKSYFDWYEPNNTPHVAWDLCDNEGEWIDSEHADDDWYQVCVTMGEQWLTVEFQSDDGGPKGIIEIALYDDSVLGVPPGDPLPLPLASSTGPRIDYVVERGGDYFILVYSDAPPSGTRYRLRWQDSAVFGRHIFYNNSAFDGNDPEAGEADDEAIAPDKTALLSGQTATFQNYTSYSRGINGIMVDIAGLQDPEALNANDFEFHVGNDNDPGSWEPVTATPTVRVRPDEGFANSDRVTIIWPDNTITIQNEWLQVTALVTDNTGLETADVFYFGNAIGESGNSPTDAKVNAFDMLAARDNQRTFIDPAPIDFPFDFDRNARVDAAELSKRVSDRYTTGADLADDLRHFLQKASPLAESAEGASTASGASATSLPTPPPTPASGATATATPTPTPGPVASWSDQPIKIVPKGLRSFDAQDADFFLDLLPGPRDRDGLPESIRFWKNRIEESDPDNTFRVGLIYGPSGCGKTSLIRAGLLPRLDDKVISLYVEATAEQTETRLLGGLRRRCPRLPGDLGLKESVAAIRRGGGVAAGKKVLIVLDQFERWLHVRRDQKDATLIEALRQCDGGRVQCLLMVRSDFWLAVTRFMAALEIDLLQSHNTAAVDLFDHAHARKVLLALGRALGALPEGAGKLQKEHKAFLERAVSGLAEDHKVVCVRLALFAEMMKAKPWTSASLKEVGGTEGIGVDFLEEAFCSDTANPEHRLHEAAARRVLRALLPERGAGIRKHVRPYAELVRVGKMVIQRRGAGGTAAETERR